METYTMPSPRLKCSILAGSKLKADPHEANSSETILWSENKKVVDLKYNKEESSTDHDFVDSGSIKRIKNENESDLLFEESFYIKWETGTFKKTQVESNGRNINSDVKEPCEIKIEANDTEEVTAEDLNYSDDSPIKSEIIQQEEVQIKNEEDNEDRLKSKIIEKPRKQAMLHQCPECLYKTPKKTNLKRHLIIKHNKGKEVDWYVCQECPYKTLQKRHLKIHTEIHNSLVLKCLKCSYETLRPTSFEKHQIQHNTNVQWLNCPECSFKTPLQSSFKRHLRAHKKDTFKCASCPYRTGRKYLLTLHQGKHESKDKWISCLLCPYKTYDKNTLKRHYQGRHSTDLNNCKRIEIFKCTECSFESGCKPTLKRHQQIHDQNSWLQCQDCAFKTCYKRSLKIHCQVKHHRENGAEIQDEIQLFECSQCSFKTSYKRHLRRHRLIHKEADEIQWFCCYECGHKAKQKANLVIHMLKHKKQTAKGHLPNNDK